MRAPLKDYQAEWDALTPDQQQAARDEANDRDAVFAIRAEITSDDWRRREDHFAAMQTSDYADYSREHRSQD